MDCQWDEWLASLRQFGAPPRCFHLYSFIGTPALLERVPEDLSLYGLGEVRVGPRKMTPADQSMRKSIQDLVSSIDPNVRVEPEVEDVSYFRPFDVCD